MPRYLILMAIQLAAIGAMPAAPGGALAHERRTIGDRPGSSERRPNYAVARVRSTVIGVLGLVAGVTGRVTRRRLATARSANGALRSAS